MNTSTFRNQKERKPEMAEARMEGLLNIGQAAKVSGISSKRIRHYEQVGLIPPANRTFTNYRLYSPADLHTLEFIKSARSFGFSIKQIKELLSLWQNTHRSSEEVKRLATEHLAELDKKIDEMQAMSTSIRKLTELCHGDQRPDCPILDGLASK